MIIIPEDLWYIRGYKRTVGNTNAKLAYMCAAEYTKAGDESAAFKKRKDTGIKWAKATVSKDNSLEEADFYLNYEGSFKNEPRTGFKIVDYATRYNTDNKLIRIEDPAGFVIEVPVENAIGLLHESTVAFGSVQEPCVWGRNGNNHWLVPTTGEVYKTAHETTLTAKEDMVSFSHIQIGDIVSFTADKAQTYIYLGKIKVSYDLKERVGTKNPKTSGWLNAKYLYDPLSDEVTKEVLCAEDKQTKHLFVPEKYLEGILTNSLEGVYGIEFKGSGKVVITCKAEATGYNTLDITQKLIKFLKDHYRLYPTDKLLEANGITTATAGCRCERVYRTYAIVKFNINGKDYEVVDTYKE